MKSEINCINEETYEYPLLMESTTNLGLIILATDAGDDWIEGTVVHNSSGANHKVGDYSKKWTKYCFVPLNGSITLSND